MKLLDPDKLAAAMVEGARAYIDATMAPVLKRLADAEARAGAAEAQIADLVKAAVGAIPPPQPGASVTVDDCRPMIDEAVSLAVSEAVRGIPAPKDGVGFTDAVIDRTGSLVLTRSDGSTVPLGRVVGRSVTEAQIADLVRQAVEALPAPKDGESVDPVEVARMVAEAVKAGLAEISKEAISREPSREAIEVMEREAIPAPAELPDIPAMVREAVDAIPRPKDGDSVTPDQVRPVLTELVEAAVKALPPAEPGKSITVEDVAPLIAEQVARAMEAIEKPQDGRSVTVEELQPLVERTVSLAISDAVAAIPTPKDGNDADPAEVERLVTETVTRVLDAWDKPKDGSSVTVNDVAPMIAAEAGKAVAALPKAEKGDAGAPGKLPLVRAWIDTVHRESDVVTHDGATYQAMRDTGKEPPHADWICLAAAGAPGKAADEIEVKGTYEVEIAYKRLNIVALNGAAFMARKDDPGPCPGADWQVIAMRGKPGAPGEPGKKGDTVKGDPGPALTKLTIDGQGLLTAKNADGSIVECDLYPVLVKVMN